MTYGNILSVAWDKVSYTLLRVVYSLQNIFKDAFKHIIRYILPYAVYLSLAGQFYKWMERYRSGHNEAVLKTVCPKGRVGSNPTLSVLKRDLVISLFLCTY